MYCPVCLKTYKFHGTRCPRCEVDLVADRSPGAPDPEAGVVCVFEAHDPGMLALATMALDAEHIDFSTRTRGMPMVFGWLGQSTTPGNVRAATEIVVAADVADRARGVLADLAAAADPQGRPAAALLLEPSPEEWTAPGVELRDKDTGASLGRITADHLQFLRDHLEEESSTDVDYYIDGATIDLLVEAQADAGLIELLRRALGARDGMEVRWSPP